MRTELDGRTAGILVGAVVLLAIVIGYLYLNPIHSTPPPPKPGSVKVSAPSIPAGPLPSNIIRHGPVGP